MKYTGTRRLQAINGHSLYINTPRAWVRAHELKPHMLMKVSIDDADRLIIEPSKTEVEEVNDA